MNRPRSGLQILGSFIDHLDYHVCIEHILSWGLARESRTVCICNVHVVVTASADPALQTAVNTSDMATPDGMPLVWTLRHYGFPSAHRVSGYDLMLGILSGISSGGLPVFFYGSTARTLDLLKRRIGYRFPKLHIAGSYAPPFRPLTPDEDSRVIDMLDSSGAGIVFVGLGCPKQELWMADHRGKINAVLIGVGAAMDFHAGTIIRAPERLQRIGLEWLHRLFQEPQRLFGRYWRTNLIFIKHALQGRLVNR